MFFKKGVDVRTAPGDGRFIFATAGPPEGVPVALRLKSEASHTGIAVDLPKIEEAIGALLRAASAPSGASDSASASASNDDGDAATSAEAAGGRGGCYFPCRLNSGFSLRFDDPCNFLEAALGSKEISVQLFYLFIFFLTRLIEKPMQLGVWGAGVGRGVGGVKELGGCTS